MSSLFPPVIDPEDLYNVLKDLITSEVIKIIEGQDEYISEKISNITAGLLDRVKDEVWSELTPLIVGFGVIGFGLWGSLFGLLIKVNKKLNEKREREKELDDTI